MTRLADTVVADDVRQRACAGDDAARATIYAAFAPATLTLIRRMVGERAISEDIFQDTMMILFERLQQFRGEAPLGAWLRQIAIRRCLMYLRSPWRRLRLALEPDEFVCETPTPLSAAFRGELIDVERALESLGPTARAVVWMYEVEGYSHQEIAHAFGRSVSFSKSQLARAHARLRACFEPEENRPSCLI
jgi:RNA polymerase sigma factor (sigma-70 family)